MADQVSTLIGTRADTVRSQPSPERDSTSRLFFDRLAVVSRYRHLIVVAMLLAIVGALLKTYTTLPLYRAHATVLLEETQVSADVFRSAPRRYYQDREPFLETQYRVLQSRELALRAVERLDLADAPELNGEGPEPPVLQAAFVSFQRAVTAALRRLVAGSARREPPAPAAPPSPDALATALLSRVRVTPVPNSQLVNVGFQAADPELAARAANVLAEEYVRLNLEIKLASMDETLTWLAEELTRQRATVEAAEYRLATYRETQNALSLDGTQDIVTTRLQQLNNALTVAETTRAQKEALYDQVQVLGVNSAAARALPAVLQNPTVRDVKTRLTVLEAERAWLSQRYGARHPEILKIDAGIAAATRELEGATTLAILSLRSDFEAALAEERALRAELDAQKDAALVLNRKSVDYGVLERDAASEQQVYETLLQREKELRIESHLQTNNVRLVDRATVPGAPFTPNTRGDLVLAIVFALIGSVGLAFGLNAIDDTLKTPEDVTRQLNVPFLGLTPAVPGERRPLLSDPAVPADFKEYYRALRTSLVFTVRTLPDHASRTVAVTSAQPLEGKTTTACNLAMVLTSGGARVLLIDGDMRRPSVHTVFGLRNGVGLSNVLVGQNGLGEAIHRTEDPKLYIMPAGHVPPNPAGLLASAEMVDLLHRLVNQPVERHTQAAGGRSRDVSDLGPFDWVIIDTPPVLAVTDAVTLMPSVSGLVFVLGAEMTRLGAAERALNLLRAAGPADVGVVLNRVNFNRNKFYYHRYYGHRQQYYYDQAAARIPQNEAARQRSAARLESGNGHSDTRGARGHAEIEAVYDHSRDGANEAASQRSDARLESGNGHSETRRARGHTAIEAVYDYHSRDGTLVAQKVGNPPKSFRWRRPDPDARGGWCWGLQDVTPGLYREPQLAGARVVFLVEGEHAADVLTRIGLVATCPSAGASSWKPEWSQDLWSLGCRELVILADHDRAGKRHAEGVAAAMYALKCEEPVAAKVVLLPGLAPGADIVDWLEAGHSRDDLLAVVADTPVWAPGAAERHRAQICREKTRERVRRHRARMCTGVGAQRRPPADSRREAATRAALTAVLAMLETGGEPRSGRALKAVLADSAHARDAIEGALKLGVRTGALVLEAGARRAKLYRPRSDNELAA